MTVYFTGDQHFAHQSQKGGIIKYCDRPFATIDEMDEVLITEWNKVVSPNDTIYHLGDFTLGNEQVARRYFLRLNGKVFILGNTFHHDKRWLKARKPYWTRQCEVTILPPIYVMKINELFIVLCHFPLAEGHWPRVHYNSISLFAHCHGRYKPRGKALDVGVDSVAKIWGQYRPVSLAEIVEYMEGR